MRKIILCLQFILLSFSINAQEQSENQSEKFWYEDAKSHIDETKMEIVHYHNSLDYYRINKETGEVWMLNDRKAHLIEKENSTNDVVLKDKTNFQLIVGRVNVYLMNLNSGEIWYLKTPNPFTKGSYRFILVNLE
ncbi:MAG: hypothetical protein MJZ24_03135 [Paludibacteraceae bacterium]|nr:hypothetical protein [Paludibacteraceae bacterium]